MEDFFRFLGDFLMIASRAVLIKKIYATGSVSGLSLRTQLLYLLAYVFRYIDIFYFSYPLSLLAVYNRIMKVIFISYQSFIIYLILRKYKATYNSRYDTFPVFIPLAICFFIAAITKGETYGLWNYFDELLYTASLIIEAIAILPQLSLVQEAGESESLTALHIMLLGMYRLSYVINFILRGLRYGRYNLMLIITGIIQTALYVDFYAVYYRRISDVFSGFSVPATSK